jgi:phosphoenolpyruvate synthase/pyruvate phosphate dikinase
MHSKGPSIVPLDELRRTNLDRFGSKATTLGILIHAGFNVPGGITLDPSVAANPFPHQSKIFDLLSRDGLFAVRSSAIGEDGKGHAWAGMFQSFLSVSRNEVMERILSCSESHRSMRVKKYADYHNICHGGVAVIVQKMIDARISGVTFSRHPLDVERKSCVIEAVRGTGDMLVSGISTPLRTIIDSDGSTPEHTAGELLSESAIQELRYIAIQVEILLSCPVDIEWAIDANNIIYVLQARPITA